MGNTAEPPHGVELELAAGQRAQAQRLGIQEGALQLNSRVHDLLAKGVYDIRGHIAMSTRELAPSPGSLTVGGGQSDDCRQGQHKNAQAHQQHLGSVRITDNA